MISLKLSSWVRGSGCLSCGTQTLNVIELSQRSNSTQFAVCDACLVDLKNEIIRAQVIAGTLGMTGG
jgi:hypothetical protein